MLPCDKHYRTVFLFCMCYEPPEGIQAEYGRASSLCRQQVDFPAKEMLCA